MSGLFMRLAFLHLILLPLASFSQQRISITITKTDTAIYDALYLFGYGYGQVSLIDTVALKPDSAHYFLSNDSYHGYGILSPSKTNYDYGIHFILNPEEKDVALEMSFPRFLKGEFVFKNSPSNNLAFKIQGMRHRFAEDFAELSTLKGSLDPTEPEYAKKLARIDLRYHKVYHQINLMLDSISNTLDSTQPFLKQVVIPFWKMPTPFDVKTDGTIKTRRDFLQAHFFDAVDFKNPLTFHYPDIINSFEFYLSNAIPYTNEGYRKAIDKFTELVQQTDSTGAEFIMDFLTRYFSNRNYQEAVSYIEDKRSSCEIKESTIKTKGTIDFNQIVLQQDTTQVKLSELVDEGKFNLIYVWIDWCEACKAKEPKAKELFAQLSKFKNTNIITIEVDSKQASKRFENTTQLAEIAELSNSLVLPFFKVFTTPQFLIVNHKGQVQYTTTNPKMAKKAAVEILMTTDY